MGDEVPAWGTPEPVPAYGSPPTGHEGHEGHEGESDAEACSPEGAQTPAWGTPEPARTAVDERLDAVVRARRDPPRRSAGKARGGGPWGVVGVVVGLTLGVLHAVLGSGSDDASPRFTVRPAPFVAGVDTLPHPLGELNPGDCLAQEPARRPSPLDETVRTSCDEPHAAEMVGRGELADGPWPGDARVDADAAVLCDDAYRRFTSAGSAGAGTAPSDVFVMRVTPWDYQWDQGDRRVLCIATRLSGELLEGSLATAQPTF